MKNFIEDYILRQILFYDGLLLNLFYWHSFKIIPSSSQAPVKLADLSKTFVSFTCLLTQLSRKVVKKLGLSCAKLRIS